MVFATTVLRSAQPAFRSAYGPKYHFQTNFKGITAQRLYRLGIQVAPFGAAAAAGLLFFASGIPRIQSDILQKIPVVGSYFKKEVHPADSPF